MKTDLLAKILETAGHEETPEKEALSAVRQARALLGRSGKSFADVLGGSVTVVQSVMPTNANVPYAKWVEKVATLEAEIRELNAKPRSAATVSATAARAAKAEKEAERVLALNAKLTSRADELLVSNKRLIADNNRLTRALKAANVRAGEQATIAEIMPSIDVSGDVSYDEWAEAVALKLGSAQGWQMTIEEQTGKMGADKLISRRDIQRWRKRGMVPDMAVKILKEIEVNEGDEPAIVWTATKVAQVRALVDQKMSEMKIATRLTERWGQRVTDNNIKRLKHDSRTKQRLWTERGWGPPMGQPRSTIGTMRASPVSQSAAAERVRFTPSADRSSHG